MGGTTQNFTNDRTRQAATRALDAKIRSRLRNPPDSGPVVAALLRESLPQSLRPVQGVWKDRPQCALHQGARLTSWYFGGGDVRRVGTRSTMKSSVGSM